MPSANSPAIGEWAEERAAEKWGLKVDRRGYHDLKADNGTVYQVKSAAHERPSGNPGKFRVWEDEVEELRERQSSYILLLYTHNTDERPAKVLKAEKVGVEEVAEAVEEAGGWYRAGHEKKDGRQHKLPWRDVLDL